MTLDLILLTFIGGIYHQIDNFFIHVLDTKNGNPVR